jgi:hypothetical protein
VEASSFKPTVLMLGLVAAGCTESRDLGSTVPHGRLPVDERNPIIVANDGAFDNWQGEYAILLASGGGPKLAGIVVNTSGSWPDIATNIAGWRGLVTAASASGIRDVPYPVASIGAPLIRPADGKFQSTVPNRSEGARVIVEKSLELSLPYRPLVVATGGRLTDLADAYLMDPTVTERVVVVSSMGSVTPSGATLTNPNGEMDPWADAIVTKVFRFVVVSSFYDQLTDVPTSRLSALPANPLGEWIAAKQPKVWSLREAGDQVAVLAVGIPSFVGAVETVSVASVVGPGATVGPDLAKDPNGSAWLVTQVSGSVATARFWQALQERTTYGP